MNHKASRLINISNVFFVSLILFLPITSFGQKNPHVTILAITGEKFHETCKSSDTLDIGICLGYTMGLSDGLAILQSGDMDRFKPICIPHQANVGQQRDVIVNYISRHPANRHEAIVALAISAWREAWPCSSN